MNATVEIHASTKAEADPKARDAFKGFYGHSRFRVVSSDATAYVIRADGAVVSWRCSFEAEETR